MKNGFDFFHFFPFYNSWSWFNWKYELIWCCWITLLYSRREYKAVLRSWLFSYFRLSEQFLKTKFISYYKQNWKLSFSIFDNISIFDTQRDHHSVAILWRCRIICHSVSCYAMIKTHFSSKTWLKLKKYLLFCITFA